MKKTLNAVLAVVLAVAMFAGFAYIATPERSNEYQIALVSAKAVTVQDTVLGVRSYGDLADATKGFQVNEVIHLAITTEVKNLEKPASNNKYKSISGKDIKVVVGSPNVDLQFARMSNPTLLAHVWSGYSVQNVATVGYVLYAGEVLKYDKATNEISWEFTGVDLYAMEVNGNLSYNLVTFNPDVKDGKIVIPAIKLKDRDASWVLGQKTFDTTYEAPEAVQYTMVLSGVTKDNAGAAEGEFYAKILISGAEKFVDEAKYYFGNDNYVSSKAPANQKKWLDYVEVDVKKLEIAGGYTVYRYDVPSSAVMRDVPIIFGGGYDDFNGKTAYLDGKLLAKVNTNTWDFATSKANKTTVNTAGGVTVEKKVFDTYGGNTTSERPMTSVVYTTTKMYYAPGFYGGTHNLGNVAGTLTSTEFAPGTFSKVSAPSSQSRVEKYTLELPAGVAYDLSNIYVFQADKLALSNAGEYDFAAAPQTAAPFGGGIAPATISLETAFSGRVGSSVTQWFNNYYKTNAIVTAADYVDITAGDGYRLKHNGEYRATDILNPNGTRTITVTPSTASGSTSNTIPLGSGALLGGNQWVVFYADPTQIGKLATSFNDLHMNNKLVAPGLYDLGTTSDTKVVAPVIVNPATITAGYDAAAVRIAASSGIASVATLFDGRVANILTISDLRSLVGTWDDAVPVVALKTGADIVNNALADSEFFWPVFDEHVADMEIGNSNAVGVTFGALVREGSGKYSSVGVVGNPAEHVDFEYLSQVVLAKLYDTNKTNVSKNTPPLTSANPDGYILYSGSAVAPKVPKELLDAAGIPIAPIYWAKGAKIVDSTDIAGFEDIQYTNLWKLNAANGWDAVTMNNNQFDNFRQGYTWLKLSLDLGITGNEIIWNNKLAAPENVWDTIVYHNGIVVYTITNNSSDRPYISLATEKATYSSDDGYGIALFDGWNLDKNEAARIYRSNDSNLSYSDAATGGHVNESAAMISALKYFGLDTSFGTTFRVINSTFADKGSPAVYSENVTGTFKYGNLEIIGEQIDEGTPEEVIEEDPIDEDPIDEDPIDEDPIDEDPIDEEPVVNEVVVVRTGNASANVAIALVASAIVAAAGLAFVMKKRVH